MVSFLSKGCFLTETMRAQGRNNTSSSIFFLACCLLLLLLFAPADASDDSRPQSPHLRHRRAAEKSPGDGDASSSSYSDPKMKLVWHDASRFVPSAKNPSPDKATVSSATVAGKFVQNALSLKEAMEKYKYENEHPAASYWTDSIQDASIYVKGEAVFELDVFAPEVPELNTDRGAIWCSVYTQKNACEDGDTGEFDNDCTEMDRVSARVDLRTGQIMATAPGVDQGTWDLTEQEGLQVTAPSGQFRPIRDFDHAAAFYTYGIEWREDRVTWWIEGLPGVEGRLRLWEVRSGRYGDHAIPSMPSKTMFNLWRTNRDWITQQNATNLSQDVVMEIDYVKVEELG